MDISLLTALVLIVTPPEKVDVAAIDNPILRFQMRSVAVEWEVIGEREWESFVYWPMTNDMIRQYHMAWERVCDAPPAKDIETFFYTNDMIRENIDFNLRHACFLTTRRSVDGPTKEEAWNAWIDDNQELYMAWYYLQQAKYARNSVRDRRAALFDLKSTIGKKAYDSRLMPPAVPIHRFFSADH